MYFQTGDIAGLRLFYREAGDLSKPNLNRATIWATKQFLEIILAALRH
jgi:hypothetical protein